MVRLKRVLLPLGVLLLVGTGMAGCLEAVVFDPDCAPTAVAATWTQTGIWKAFPGEGVHGPYNVSLREQQGHVLVDPDWGRLVADRIDRTVQWEEDNLSLLYRMDHKDTLRVAAPADLDEGRVEEGFLTFLQSVSLMEERELRPMIHELIQKGGRPFSSPAQAGSQSQTAGTVQGNGSEIEYTLTVSGSFRFEALYQDLLAKSGQDERPHPWLDGTVTLEDWTFHFPAPVAVANHTHETGRFLQVDGRDQVAFHWDPPTGVGEEALEAGIARTLSDLGLEAPEDLDDVEVYTVTC